MVHISETAHGKMKIIFEGVTFHDYFYDNTFCGIPSQDKPTVIVIFSRFESGIDLVFNRVLKNTKVSHPLCTRC